jgi:hypothetical protein
MPVKKGDRLRNKRTGGTATALSNEHNGNVVVKQDDGATANWSIHDCEVVEE